jgi:hypothetical protein
MSCFGQEILPIHCMYINIHTCIDVYITHSVHYGTLLKKTNEAETGRLGKRDFNYNFMSRDIEEFRRCFSIMFLRLWK